MAPRPRAGALAPARAERELVGHYGGKTIRGGAHGQYEVAIVHVEEGPPMLVTGTKAIQLFDAAEISPGWPVRLRYLGMVATRSGRLMKDFELYVADGLPISVPAPDEVFQ